MTPACWWPAWMPKLTNLLNIHLDEPEGHSYNLPPRMNLVRILFDTHNLTFPEERRRMRAITNLLYEHFRLRDASGGCGRCSCRPISVRHWTIENSKAIEL